MADKTVLCLCLDITEQDLDRAVAEGFTDAETLKRYTASFMGPCQGKSCMDTILARLADKTGVDPESLRRPTLRPPAHPIRLGILAGLGGADAS
ncbi:(2Fe-2S)-binding protein [Amycolatopsis jejuensis]|uniref:(2Fe-2S)-binding protein n=1 Tax=Amycolatopsis jejuensis TaxID=330084 RepID=UPI000527CF16|nr:(2Fe-2S)-binding protein [Amycolatopsis jejuensis]